MLQIRIADLAESSWYALFLCLKVLKFPLGGSIRLLEATSSQTSHSFPSQMNSSRCRSPPGAGRPAGTDETQGVPVPTGTPIKPGSFPREDPYNHATPSLRPAAGRVNEGSAGTPGAGRNSEPGKPVRRARKGPGDFWVAGDSTLGIAFLRAGPAVLGDGWPGRLRHPRRLET